jgi:hypothetical protein
MTYRGQVANGQIVLNERVQLPEGAIVQVEVMEAKLRITHPTRREPFQKFHAITMPGDSLADELVRERR